MVPLAVAPAAQLQASAAPTSTEAAQTATAGLVTLIPEGLVLLMSVTFAVAAVRLAKRNTLVQQMSATESLASVDTICVDKTGTLTAGELRLTGVEFAEGVDPRPARRRWGASPPAPATATGPWRRSPSAFPGEAGRVARRGAVLLGVEVERGLARRRGGGATYVLGAPDILAEAGALTLPPGLAAQARGGDRGRPAGRRLRRDERGAARRPGARRGAAAARRWRWSCWRRRCAPTRRRRSPTCASRKST